MMKAFEIDNEDVETPNHNRDIPDANIINQPEPEPDKQGENGSPRKVEI